MCGQARTRHLARFTELEDEHAAIDTQLAALAKTTHDTGHPDLLDALPLLGDLLTEDPIQLQQMLSRRGSDRRRLSAG